VETVYSLSQARADGGHVTFDFIVEPRAAGWWRHDFDPGGSYAAIAPSSIEELREELATVAWDQAVDRLEQARDRDPDTLPGAIRTVELVWSARQAVRRMLGTRRAA